MTTRTAWPQRVFDAHAERMNAAHAATNAAHAVWRRTRAPADRARWEATLPAFHAAFGGPVGEAIGDCWAHGLDDADRRAFAFAFLAAAPRFFRSGYVADALLRQAKRLDLTAPERDALARHVLARVAHGPGRHFQRALRVAHAAGADRLAPALEAMTADPDPAVRHRARIALAKLRRPS